MDEQAYRVWWPLHLRVAKGETLSPEQQTLYLEGKRRLHEEETLEGSLALLRQTRAEIKTLEAEREALLERRRQLRERVTLLEASLSDKAKRALGVGE